MNLTPDAIKLTKFAGLLRSGVSLEQALASIGGVPTNSVGLSYVLTVANNSGSSVANEIDSVAALVRTRDRFTQRIRVAHANPKSTSRLVIWLPLLTLAMAQLVGWDVIGTLLERPIVFVSFLLGLCLLLTSKLVTSRMLRRSQPEETSAGFYLLGVALATSGGASLFQAKELVSKIYFEHFGQEPPDTELFELQQIEQLVSETGARVSELLLRQSQSMQEEENVKTEIKIEKLGVRLMLPLGLGVLPAFVLLAIVPLMVTMLGSK
jgi:tight adherence protein B